MLELTWLLLVSPGLQLALRAGCCPSSPRTPHPERKLLNIPEPHSRLKLSKTWNLNLRAPEPPVTAAYR